MISRFAPIAEACRIEVPEAIRRAIAIVGAGAIVDVAHLPAYRAAGLEVAGIYNHHPARAADVAARHRVPRVYETLEDVLVRRAGGGGRCRRDRGRPARDRQARA